MSEKRPNREIWISIGLVAAVLVIALIFARMPDTPGHKMEGSQVPEMHYMTQGNKPVRISDSKGTVVLMNFWAIWCEPCMKEMPSLRELEDYFQGKDFSLLAFDLGQGEKAIEGRIEGGKYPRNLIFKFSRENLKGFGVEGLPLSILIDRKGVVKKVFRGGQNWMDPEIIEKIEDLIEDK